jgi:hypothetical protein
MAFISTLPFTLTCPKYLLLGALTALFMVKDFDVVPRTKGGALRVSPDAETATPVPAPIAIPFEES